MNWISENWFWVLLAIASLLLLRRGHGHGVLGGLLGGHGHHGGHHDSDERDSGQAGPPSREAAIDPVSGQAVRIGDALTSVFRGRVYYFQSRESRAQFEAAPERYAGGSAGEALPGDEPDVRSRPHRRRGC